MFWSGNIVGQHTHWVSEAERHLLVNSILNNGYISGAEILLAAEKEENVEELRKFLVSVRPRDAESFIKRFPAFSWLFIRPPVGLNSRTVIETGMKLIQIKRDVYFVSKVSSAPPG